MTISNEIWDKFVLLSDPKTRWVRGSPRYTGEACLLVSFGGRGFSHDARVWLEDFIGGYELGIDKIGMVYYNDTLAKDRGAVIDMLEEAYEQRRWEEELA